ncbi:MAG: NACHT domain-containing protein [Ignavibacteria bacterium]|nr:NACHT domain-containing protein [Ignavibacteria bacterium]
MNELFDYNKIGAELIQNYVNSFAKGVFDGGESVLKSLQTKLKISYSKYLKAAIKKYTKTKTILYRDKPVPLYDFYEHVKVRCDKEVIDTSNIDNLLKVNDYIIITGTAGSGKSTLLKHLYLNALTKKKLIPIFIELRTLNNSKTTLVEHIYDTIYNLGFTLEIEYLIKSLTSGGLLIFLDGYDEVKNELKFSVTQEILNATTKYPNNNFIVSSRPDDEFISWTNFTQFRALPLDKEQACRLIAKLSYDQVVKDLFLTSLKQGLYEKHKDFLSIPLLLTIMLMTYGENADIPNKMHIFYSQVFDTLFNKHDATKAVYKRKMYTNLAIDDFKTVLSAFSILTHSVHTTVFTSDEAISYLSKSKKLTCIVFKEEAYLKDLLKSVCILLQEGLSYTFTHKTFQEFFSALYILKTEPQIQVKFLEALDWDIDKDKILQMLFEMNPELIERKLVIPKLELILKNYEITSTINNQQRLIFLANMFDKLTISKNNGFMSLTINNFKDFHFLTTLHRFYPNRIYSKPFLSDQLFTGLLEYSKNLVVKTEIINLSELSYNTEIGKLLLLEPNYYNRSIDFMSDVLNQLKKKHKERAMSIEKLLLNN